MKDDLKEFCEKEIQQYKSLLNEMHASPQRIYGMIAAMERLIEYIDDYED